MNRPNSLLWEPQLSQFYADCGMDESSGRSSLLSVFHVHHLPQCMDWLLPKESGCWLLRAPAGYSIVSTLLVSCSAYI